MSIPILGKNEALKTVGPFEIIGRALLRTRYLHVNEA